MTLVNILLAAFGIGLLIFVHELGHYIAARMAGVRVEVFSLGFGPRLWGFSWRNTDFRLSLVPFGGFVIVAGADPSDRRYPARESLWAKTIPQRALFWSGGVIMNVLFALIVFPIVFGVGVSFLAPVIGSVTPGSPAWEVGIRPGDRIVSVQGKEILSLDNLAAEVALHGHRPVAIVLQRDETEMVVTATPRFDAESGLYRIGIGQAYGPFTLEVTPNGAAATAGLRDGDELVRINDLPAADGQAFATQRHSGDPWKVEVQRGEALVAATIERPKAEAPMAPRIGVVPSTRKVLGIKNDAVMAPRLGLERDDVILAIDGLAFLAGDLAAFATGPDILRLQVGRNGKEVALQAPATAAERVALATEIALGGDDSLRLQPVADTAASAAGMLGGDLVETVDGRAVENWDELREAVERAGDKPLKFGLRRLAANATTFFDAETGDLPRGAALELVIAPRSRAVFDYGFTASAAPIRAEVRADGFGDALRLGVVCSVDLLKQSYVTLKRMITGDVGAKNLGGIIRISEFSYRAAQRGSSWFWYFLALISVNLAFVNLLPIPVLDGGHMLFLLIEKVKGSPVSSRVFGYSQIVGLVFVLLLVLFVTYNDIMRHL